MAGLLLAGFGLRMFQLGADSLWNDEAGQVLAATRPTMAAMLAEIRTHAMAMPLDYFVTGLVAKVGLYEELLRFPAVVWGVLTLALLFRFLACFSRWGVALAGLWLLAILPAHVYYSQEMRFYAALACLFMLSNLLMFKALHASSGRHWIVFVLATAIGAYFHPYVLLVPVTGFCYLLLIGASLHPLDGRLRGLLIGSVALGLLFAPGYLYFGAHQTYAFVLMEFGGVLYRAIARGLGWLSLPYTSRTPSLGAWELAYAGASMLGALVLARRWRQERVMAAFVVGAVAQVILIILADWYKGYFFAPRQLLHSSIALLILAAFGVATLASVLPGPFRAVDRQRGHGIRSTVWLCGILIGLSLIALPRLADVYATPKSNAEQIVAELLLTHQRDEPVLVIPAHEDKIYRFYLSQAVVSAHLLNSLVPIDIGQISEHSMKSTGSLFLIAPSTISERELRDLRSQKFRLLVDPAEKWNYARYLFVRE